MTGSGELGKVFGFYTEPATSTPAATGLKVLKDDPVLGIVTA